MSSSHEIKLCEEFTIQLNEQGVPISFSDSRPYRYGLGQQEIQSNYWTYPVTRLEHDALLRAVSESIAAGKPLTETVIKTLEARVCATDERHKNFQATLEKNRELYSTDKCDQKTACDEIEQHAQQFRAYLNETLTL